MYYSKKTDQQVKLSSILYAIVYMFNFIVLLTKDIITTTDFIKRSCCMKNNFIYYKKMLIQKSPSMNNIYRSLNLIFFLVFITHAHIMSHGCIEIQRIKIFILLSSKQLTKPHHQLFFLYF